MRSLSPIRAVTQPLLVALGSFFFVANMTVAALSFAPTAAPSAGSTDAAILGTIVTSAVTDVKVCEMAAARSQNNDVRYFCRTATADDSRIALQGMQLAQRLGASDIELQPDSRTPRILELIGRNSGREFDRSFLLMRINYDGNLAHTLRFGAEFALDAAVRRYDNFAMSTVLRHLEAAESLLRRISETTY